MRRFYASPDQFDASTVTLGGEETRHLRNVLRLKIGDEAQVFDGAGREYVCEIADILKAGARLSIVREIDPAAPESELDLTLVTSVYKNDKLDLVIQKAVELGVVRLIPVVAFRSEAGLRDSSKRTARWRKIALEATKQCERALLMSIDEPMMLDEYLDGPASGSDTRLIFSEKGGESIPAIADTKKITALIGPKGGWEDSEIELAGERGFVPVKLGRRIMRAETAAMTFAAILQHRFGDLA